MSGTIFYFNWEVALIEWLQNFASPLLVSIVSSFSIFGEELLIIGVLGFFYWSYDKKLGRHLGTTLLVALMIAPMIKNIVVRRRPYFDNEGIRCLRPVKKGAELYDIAAHGYSFPSMHSINAITLYSGLAIHFKKKIGYFFAAILVFMVGFSRVFVGVHYPTDVLAGWGIGILIIWLIPIVQRKINNSLIFAIVLAILALPGWFYCTSDDFYTVYGIMCGMMLGFWFEEKKVNFENTNNIIHMILRVVAGGVLFFVITVFLKMPFSEELLKSGNFIAHMVRALRYFVASFVVIGIYPISFKLFNKNIEN